MSKQSSMKRDLKPIRSDADHQAALAEMERLWGAKSGTPHGDRLDILATLVDAYEGDQYPMDPPDPVDAISFRLDSQGLNKRDLEPIIGSRALVEDILERRRADRSHDTEIA
jgi:HTH-type transcriptional regulator/antitoxin HigA